MFSNEKNQNFKRLVTMTNAQNRSSVVVSYTPVGFWSEEVVSARVTLQKSCAESSTPDTVVHGDFDVDVKLRHSIGGMDDTLTHLEAYRNFHAALTDAIALTDWVQAQASGLTQDELLFELLQIDACRDGFDHEEEGSIIKPDQIAVIDLGLNEFICQGIGYRSAQAASNAALAKFPASKVQIRSAEDAEAVMWRFGLHAGVVPYEVS
jgi:hypothetical protein